MLFIQYEQKKLFENLVICIRHPTDAKIILFMCGLLCFTKTVCIKHWHIFLSN